MNLPHNICIGLGAGVSGVCIGMAIFASTSSNPKISSIIYRTHLTFFGVLKYKLRQKPYLAAMPYSSSLTDKEWE